jgi:hypothetical protein
MSEIKQLKKIYLDRKTRISAVGQKIVPALFLLFWLALCGIMVYCSFNFSNAVLFCIVTALIFLLFAFLSYRSISLMRKVSADENYMYVKQGRVEEQVPFENIYAGSKPFMRVTAALESVKFYYNSATGEKKVVKFVPANVNQMYNQFIDAVSAKNPQVKIRRSFL